MLEKLRKSLIQHGLDMLVVVSTDEHLNEYPPEQNLRLRAATGFSGSVGTAIICVEGRSQLFVDSRYHLQADQTCSDDFEIQKLGNEGVLNPAEWLAEQKNKKLKIGIDPFVMSPKTWRNYQKSVEKSGHTIIANSPNLIDSLWVERPQPLKNEIYPLAIEYTEKSAESKLEDLREIMKKTISANTANPDVLLISMLDEIAWLMNLRGSDIAYNPVFESYAAVFQDRAICFCHHPEISFEEHCPGWEFKPYEQYQNFLAELAADEKITIWLNPNGITMGSRLVFVEEQVHEDDSPLALAKAIKTNAEILASKNTHQQAGACLVKSFRKLQQALKKDQPVSEKQYADWLYEEYSQAEGFTDLSFATIAGSGPNGAIVHYGDPDGTQPMPKDNLLLIDSGIQAAGGTTDATRTIILGDADQKQKRMYTLILQAHIRLARQVFPEDTKGSALDAVTRSSLWNAGLDYGHGTGHGVGAFLNVHEGPQNISPSGNKIGFQVGMVISNEPGFYEIGWGGIRLENLYVVQEADGLPPHPGGKKWLKFESLTMIPWDRRLIELSILAAEEIEWLNVYHNRVFEKLSPLLSQTEDQEWLAWACDVK